VHPRDIDFALRSGLTREGWTCFGVRFWLHASCLTEAAWRQISSSDAAAVTSCPGGGRLRLSPVSVDGVMATISLCSWGWQAELSLTASSSGFAVFLLTEAAGPLTSSGDACILRSAFWNLQAASGVAFRVQGMPTTLASLSGVGTLRLSHCEGLFWGGLLR